LPSHKLQKVNGLRRLLLYCNKFASKIIFRNKCLQNYYFLIGIDQAERIDLGSNSDLIPTKNLVVILIWKL